MGCISNEELEDLSDKIKIGELLGTIGSLMGTI